MHSRHPRADELEPIERCSRDELEALQLERLAWSLRHAYQNVAPYRSKCDACGGHPDDLRSLADLARFPFTTKQDLREGWRSVGKAKRVIDTRSHESGAGL